MPLRWTRGLKQPTLAHSSAFYRQLQLSCRVNLCLLTICCYRCCHMGRQVEHQVPQRVSHVYESLGMLWMTIYEITFSGMCFECSSGKCATRMRLSFVVWRWHWWNDVTLAFKTEGKRSRVFLWRYPFNMQPWRRRLLAHRQLSWAIVVSILCSRCDPAENPFGPFWERHEWRRL